MKEELENGIDAEQLLRNKSWAELSDEERAVVKEIFGSESEYGSVRAMMLELRTESGIQEEELQPSEQVRENLLAAFDDEQRRRRVLWWHSLGFWLRNSLRLDIPVVRFAVAAVILILGIFTVIQLTNEEAPQDTFVNNDKPAPAPVTDSTPKLEDNIEPPGMNVQPYFFPWVNYLPQPIIDDQPDDVIVVDAGHPDLKLDSVVVPQPGNNPASLDTVPDNLAGFAVADSTGMSPAVVTFTNATICSGASNEMFATGATAPYTFNWVFDAATPTFNGAMNSNMATIVTYVPNCRSLANDSKVIGAMFSMR